MENSDSNNVLGTCMDMCPPKERAMRLRVGLVHILEDRKKMIKCFSRSAAGTDMTNPIFIRPPSVLESTIAYLFNNVLCNKDHPFPLIYEFIDDRLKSVKQDLFIQQPPAKDCVPILEPIVRFYTYAAYRLCNEATPYFDAVLNHNQLLETLKRLLREYDTCLEHSEARIEMESLFVLLNLGEPHSIFRSVGLNKPLRQELLLKCEKMSIEWYLGNYVRVCKEIPHLPLLHAALACTYQLPYVRRFALKVLNTAYSSKNLTVPLKVLSSLLLYNRENEVIDDCQLCGIKVLDTEEKAAHFIKSSWKIQSKVKCHKIHFITEGLDNSFLPELLMSPSYMNS